MNDFEHSSGPSPRRDQGEPPPRPSWVNYVAVGALLVAALVVALLLLGGGHGPGQHSG